MIGGFALNGATVDGVPRRRGAEVPSDPVIVDPPSPIDPPVEPVPGEPYVPPVIPAGYAYRWRVRVMVGDIDVTPLLTGSGEVDREEGAAAIAQFSVFYPRGAAVPMDFQGAAVTVDFLSETGGVLTTERWFTGFATEPRWDITRRVMAFTCSDHLQERVEAMSIEQIDALTPSAVWSEDLFEPAANRSHWDYCNERLKTVAGSLDASATGYIRLTPWRAKQAADFVFGPGSTLYQSASVELPQLSGVANRVEIEVEYRYARLWQKNQVYGWQNPLTGGYAGEQGFCTWRHYGSDTPDVSEVESAVEGTGQTIIQASYERLPPTGIYCNPPASWINVYPDLVLSFNVTAGRRWTQYITEKYSLVLTTPAGEREASQVVVRDSLSIEVENEKAEKWESDPVVGGQSGFKDLSAESRRAAALFGKLKAGEVALLAASRGVLVSWDVPAPMATGVDLIHTLELADHDIRARGKCRRLVRRFDQLSGSATASLTVAVMRGGGQSDPLGIPAAPPSLPQGHYGPEKPLVTQLGRHRDSGVFDENADGFSGNHNNYDDLTFEDFPRRVQLTAIEIPQERRDEYTVEASATYRVGIPDDLLEL